MFSFHIIIFSSFVSHLLTLFYSVVVQTGAILPWILINGDRFIAKSFCAFCHFFHRHRGALLLIRRYLMCALATLFLHTLAHKVECTHHFNIQTHTYTQRLYRLVNILFRYFFHHHFEIVVYCLGLLTNQISVDQKMFSMFQHFKYFTHTTHQKWFIIKLFFSLPLPCPLSLDVTYFRYFYCFTWLSYAHFSHHSKIKKTKYCTRGLKLHKLRMAEWLLFLSHTKFTTSFSLFSDLRKYSRFEYTNWISTEMLRQTRRAYIPPPFEIIIIKLILYQS